MPRRYLHYAGRLNSGVSVQWSSMSSLIFYTDIAGTGAGGFSGDCFIRAKNRMLLREIENLDHHTPNALRDL